MGENPPLSWNRRSFTSLLMALAFLVMTISGFILFVTPGGREARASAWQALGQGREAWIAVHIVFSVLFLAASVAHIALNWRALLNHFRAKQGRRTRLAEIGAALLVCGLVYAGTVWTTPPLSLLLDWRQSFKGCRGAERQGGGEGRGGCGRHETAPAQAVAGQEGHGAASQAVDAAEPRRQGQGGMGQLTLRAFCQERRLSLDTVRQTLAREGVEANPEMTLREIADRCGQHPRDLVHRLSGE